MTSFYRLRTVTRLILPQPAAWRALHIEECSAMLLEVALKIDYRGGTLNLFFFLPNAFSFFLFAEIRITRRNQFRLC